MAAKSNYLEIGSLIVNPLNVRDNTNGTELIKSLLDDGLKRVIVVAAFDAEHVPTWLETETVKFDGAVNIVIDGNRRLDGLKKALLTDDSAFFARFPKGVPCEVIENPTPEMFWRRVQDESEGKSLQTNAEFYRMFKAMKVQNPDLSHAKFVDTFGSVLNVTKARRIQLVELENKLEKCSDAIERATVLAEKRKALQDAHKGIFQTWQAVSKNRYVEAAYLYTETGIRPDSIPEESLCRVTGWGTVANSSAARLEKSWEYIIESNGKDADESLILATMAKIKIEQEEKEAAKAERDSTPYAAIAKVAKANEIKISVAGQEKDLWSFLISLYETDQMNKAAEKAAKSK